MTPVDLDSFLAHTHNAIIGVNRPGKGPQLTPVWYVWDGETFRFSTTRDRFKYPHIKRDPQISLIVDDAAAHRYVVATGRAEILEENVAELTRPVLEKYMPPEALAQGGAAMAADPSRVLVVLHPDKIVTSWS